MNQAHFIVTRPCNRATQLVEKLQQLSTKSTPLDISSCPLIEIADFIENPLPKLSNLQGVIFISGNAVDQSRKLLSKQAWSQILQNPLYAIGQQTAAILQSDLDSLLKSSSRIKSIPVKYPHQMNSEGLLALPELNNIQGQNWLIVKGEGGREKLKEGLKVAGAKVQELPVYQRKLPNLMAQKQIETYNQTQAYWLVTSVQALSHLWQILKQNPQGCQIIVSSDRIAKQAKMMGFKIIAQAKDATDHQLVACVKQFIIDRNL